jgi:branched-chain amino acid transport system ATP-binding protein
MPDTLSPLIEAAELCTSYDTSQAAGVSQYCYVMDRGRIALRGEQDKVRDDPELVRLPAP